MNQRRKNVVLSYVMGGLLAFSAWNFVFKPQRADLAGARDDLARVERDITDTKVMLAAPTTPTDSATDDALRAVPADPAMPTLLRQLQSIADDTGTTLMAISPSPLGTNPAGPGGSVQITISGTGSHRAVLDYLQRLRDLDRLVVIEQIGIDNRTAAADQQTAGPTSDQMQLSVRVYTTQTPRQPVEGS